MKNNIHVSEIKSMACRRLLTELKSNDKTELKSNDETE